jgi:hypothetical protein
MHHLLRGGLLGLVLALAVYGSRAGATSLVPLSDQELADRAHLIVIGRATARQPIWAGQDLTTMVTVAVGESLKGAAGTTLTVALPGGIDRQRKIPIEVLYVGAPHIAQGEEVVLFLERGHPHFPDAHVVSGFSQGKLSIVSDPAGVKWISRGPHQDAAGGTPEARRLKRLSDFREEIRQHLERGRP